MKTVCVLLSTYNGAKYLEEQLNSLITQKDVCVEIIVRDDGSTDQTVEILDRWKNQGYLKWYSGNNKGFAMSFMDLVMNAGIYDYYAFCDQDDIWLSDKLKVAVDKLEGIQSDCKLYCSNLYAYSDGLNKGLVRKCIPVYNKYTCLIQNIAVGCTIVFSLSLRNRMIHNMPEYLIAHDFWAYQSAMYLGEVYYDNAPYILYRQHENNLIGAKSTLADIWKRRISNFLNNRSDGRSRQAQELIKSYSTYISQEEKDKINTLANYKSSFKFRIRLLFDKRYTMGRIANNILFRLKVILGKI